MQISLIVRTLVHLFLLLGNLLLMDLSDLKKKQHSRTSQRSLSQFGSAFQLLVTYSKKKPMYRSSLIELSNFLSLFI